MKRIASSFAMSYANNLVNSSNGQITHSEALKQAYAYYNQNKAAIKAEYAAKASSEPAPSTSPENSGETVQQNPKPKRTNSASAWVMPRANNLYYQALKAAQESGMPCEMTRAQAVKVTYISYFIKVKRQTVYVEFVKDCGEVRTVAHMAAFNVEKYNAKNNTMVFKELVKGGKEEFRTVRPSRIIKHFIQNTLFG